VSSLFFILDRMRLNAVANLYSFGHSLTLVANNGPVRYAPGETDFVHTFLESL